MSPFFTRIKNYFAKFLLTHLLVTLVCLPILIIWGIPLSRMSVVGNLIFTPILTIFLILSSLIFFTELLHIPNLFLIKGLEAATNFWQKLLILGNKSWLTGFAKTSFFILLLIPIFVYLIFTHKKINNVYKRITCLGIVLITFTTYLSIQQKPPKKETILAFKKELKIKINKNGNLDIQDFGFFNRKRSIRKFLDFELKPYLLKKFGTIKIDNLSVLNPGINSFKAAQEFCNVFDIKQETLPIFDGKKLNKKAWREFFILKEVTQKNGVKFVRTSP